MRQRRQKRLLGRGAIINQEQLGRIGGNGKTTDDIAVQLERELKDPELIVQADGGVGELRRGLTAEFEGEFFAVFEVNGEVVSVVGEAVAWAVGFAESDPGGGAQVAEAAQGFFFGQAFDDALRTSSQ